MATGTDTNQFKNPLKKLVHFLEESRCLEIKMS